MPLRRQVALGDRAGSQGRAQRWLVNLGQDAGEDLASRLGVQDEPCFGLARLAGPERAHGLIIGMHLNGKPVAGIKKLDQPGEDSVPRGGRPKQRLALCLHELPQRLPLCRPGCHDAAVQRMIADLPRLAVQIIRG